MTRTLTLTLNLAASGGARGVSGTRPRAKVPVHAAAPPRARPLDRRCMLGRDAARGWAGRRGGGPGRFLGTGEEAAP